MGHRLALSSISLVTVVLTMVAVIHGFSKPTESPSAPTATFALLDAPQPVTLPTVLSDTTPGSPNARLLGTDDAGRSYFLYAENSRVCLETEHERQSGNATIQDGSLSCDLAGHLTSAVWWESFRSKNTPYLAVVLPDEYADARLHTSGTERLVLRAPNLRVYVVRPGTAVSITVASTTYRPLTANVPAQAFLNP